MFKPTMFRQLARSFSSKPDILKYIAPESEERFRLAQSAYRVAKELFEKRDISQAKIKIGDALEYLSGVQGEGPALASVSSQFWELEETIEKHDTSCSTVKNGAKALTS